MEHSEWCLLDYHHASFIFTVRYPELGVCFIRLCDFNAKISVYAIREITIWAKINKLKNFILPICQLHNIIPFICLPEQINLISNQTNLTSTNCYKSQFQKSRYKSSQGSFIIISNLHRAPIFSVVLAKNKSWCLFSIINTYRFKVSFYYYSLLFTAYTRKQLTLYYKPISFPIQSSLIYKTDKNKFKIRFTSNQNSWIFIQRSIISYESQYNVISIQSNVVFLILAV